MAASASSISGATTSTFGSTSGSESSGLKLEGFSGQAHALTIQPSSSLMKLGAASGASSALFGIFDGHGGVEVAEFCSRHFEELLRGNSHYQTKQYELALQEAFLEMDNLLQTPEGKAEIVEINKQFPAQVSQLEKALVATGSLKGTCIHLHTPLRYRERLSIRNDRRQGLHGKRRPH